MKKFRIKSTGKVFEAPGYMQEIGGKLYNNNTKRFEGVEGDIVIVTEFGKEKRGRLKDYTDFQIIPIEERENPIIVSAVGIRNGTSKIEFEHLMEIEEA